MVVRSPGSGLLPSDSPIKVRRHGEYTPASAASVVGLGLAMDLRFLSFFLSS